MKTHITGAKVKRAALRLPVDILLLAVSLFAMLPFVYMVLTSFRQVFGAINLDFDISQMNLKNYAAIFRGMPIWNYYKNSLIVVVGACALSVVCASMAGFGFVKKRFPGRQLMFNFILFTLMVPTQITMIPLFLNLNRVGLLNTHFAMMLPFVNAFAVFLVKQFVIGLPDDLLEAAKIDGANEPTTFLRIVVPLLKPVITALTIYMFLAAWNDFLWPLIIATEGSSFTITLALSLLHGQFTTNYGMVMAGSALAFIPPFLLYIILQNTFVEGIAYSGIKG